MKHITTSLFLVLEIFILPSLIVYAQNTSSNTADTVCIIDYEPLYKERLLEEVDTFVLVDDFKPLLYQPTFDVAPSFIGSFSDLLKQLKYPEEARKNNIEGSVILNVSIDEYGIVSSVEVLKMVGHSDFGPAASEWIKNIKFVPASLNGKFVPCVVVIPVKFKLN